MKNVAAAVSVSIYFRRYRSCIVGTTSVRLDTWAGDIYLFNPITDFMPNIRVNSPVVFKSTEASLWIYRGLIKSNLWFGGWLPAVVWWQHACQDWSERISLPNLTILKTNFYLVSLGTHPLFYNCGNILSSICTMILRAVASEHDQCPNQFGRFNFPQLRYSYSTCWLSFSA